MSKYIIEIYKGYYYKDSDGKMSRGNVPMTTDRNKAFCYGNLMHAGRIAQKIRRNGFDKVKILGVTLEFDGHEYDIKNFY